MTAALTVTPHPLSNEGIFPALPSVPGMSFSIQQAKYTHLTSLVLCMFTVSCQRPYTHDPVLRTLRLMYHGRVLKFLGLMAVKFLTPSSKNGWIVQKFVSTFFFLEVVLYLACVNVAIFMLWCCQGTQWNRFKSALFEEVRLQIAKFSGGCAPRPPQLFSIELTTNADHGQVLKWNPGLNTVEF